MTKNQNNLVPTVRDTRLHDGPVLKTYDRRLESFKRSVTHKCATIWNNLGVNDRNIPTLEDFKKNRSKYLASKLK